MKIYYRRSNPNSVYFDKELRKYRIRIAILETKLKKSTQKFHVLKAKQQSVCTEVVLKLRDEWFDIFQMIKNEFDLISIWYFKLCEKMNLFTESFHFENLSENRKKMSQSDRQRYREESRQRIDNYRRTCTELSTIIEKNEQSKIDLSVKRKELSSLFNEADFAHLGQKSKIIQDFSRFEFLSKSPNNSNQLKNFPDSGLSFNNQKTIPSMQANFFKVDNEKLKEATASQLDFLSPCNDLNIANLISYDTKEKSNSVVSSKDFNSSKFLNINNTHKVSLNHSWQSDFHDHSLTHRSLLESNLAKSAGTIKPLFDKSLPKAFLNVSINSDDQKHDDLEKPRQIKQNSKFLVESVASKPVTKNKSSLLQNSNAKQASQRFALKSSPKSVQKSTSNLASKLPQKSAQTSTQKLNKKSILQSKKLISKPETNLKPIPNVTTKSKMWNKKTNTYEMQQCSSSKTLESKDFSPFVIDKEMEAEAWPVELSPLKSFQRVISRTNQKSTQKSNKKSALNSVQTPVKSNLKSKTPVKPTPIVTTRSKLGNKKNDVNEMSNSKSCPTKALKSKNCSPFILDRKLEAEISPIKSSRKIINNSKIKENGYYELTSSPISDNSHYLFNCETASVQKIDIELMNDSLSTSFHTTLESSVELLRKIEKNDISCSANLQKTLNFLTKSPNHEIFEEKCGRTTRSKTQSLTKKCKEISKSKFKSTKITCNQALTTNGPNILDAIKQRRNELMLKKQKIKY